MLGRVQSIFSLALALCLPLQASAADDESVAHDTWCLRNTGTHIVYRDLKDHCSSPGGLQGPTAERDVRLKAPAIHIQQHQVWKPSPFQSARVNVQRAEKATRTNSADR